MRIERKQLNAMGIPFQLKARKDVLEVFPSWFSITIAIMLSECLVFMTGAGNGTIAVRCIADRRWAAIEEPWRVKYGGLSLSGLSEPRNELSPAKRNCVPIQSGLTGLEWGRTDMGGVVAGT